MTHARIEDYVEIRKITDLKGSIGLYLNNGKYVIYRYASRGKISNFVTEYELINNNISNQVPMDLNYGNQILDRIEQGYYFSDALIFYKNKLSELKAPNEHGQLEDKFTSTGIKFWRHQEQMINYRTGDPNSIISTHISPEGACNLKCPYCSVTYRDTHSRIPLEIIQDYVTKLKSRGLKAVILTGGGEPTAYKQFNELVRWLYKQELSIAVVTNGSIGYWNKVDEDVCKMFTWVRVSINIYDGWETKIQLPLEKFDFDKTIIGCSMVYTVENDNINAGDSITLLNKVSKLADRCGAKYIRILPNCLLTQENLMYQHTTLDKILEETTDTRFFHQYKIHRTPTSSVCHQSYFRPYLSEEVDKKTGLPGTVYPCDSVVLNGGNQFYAQEYQLCHASEILDYLDRKIKQNFDPREQCKGCVHTNNIDMLENWVNKKVNRFDEFPYPLVHENFV
jgi:organic radical activating enzyme